MQFNSFSFILITQGNKKRISIYLWWRILTTLNWLTELTRFSTALCGNSYYSSLLPNFWKYFAVVRFQVYSAIDAHLYELVTSMEAWPRRAKWPSSLGFPSTPKWITWLRNGGATRCGHKLWQQFLRNKKASFTVAWIIRTLKPQHLEQAYCQRDTSHFLGREATIKVCAAAAMLAMVSSCSRFKPDFSKSIYTSRLKKVTWINRKMQWLPIIGKLSY